MQNEIFVALGRLSDAELHTRARGLAARERDATAQLVAHLAEIERRDVHLREGYASLFVYCRDALGLSEAEAYLRIEAARAARRFPVILQRLAEGAINLTTVKLLSPHLTPENYASVLESARGKKKPEVEEVVAALAPRPDVPTILCKLPPAPSGPVPPLPLSAPMAAAGLGGRAGRNPAPPTFLRRSCAWCGCGTAAAARSSERAVIAAASAASFSSITSTRGPWAARPRSTDSP